MASTDPAVLIEEALERICAAGNYLYFGTTLESQLATRLAVTERELHLVMGELRPRDD